MDIYSISSNIPLVIALLAIDIIGTVLGTIIGVKLSGGSLNEGFIVGWGVVPKGDTEIVIATLAHNAGLISISIFTAIVTVAFITTLLAPIVFRILVRRHKEVYRK